MGSVVRALCAGLVVALAGVAAVAPLWAAPEETISLAFSAGYKEDVLRANIGKFEQATGIHQEAVREAAAGITTGRTPVPDGLKALDASISRVMAK